MNFMWWFPLTLFARERDLHGFKIQLLWYDFWVRFYFSAPAACDDPVHGKFMKLSIYFCPIPCLVFNWWWARRPNADEYTLFDMDPFEVNDDS